MMELQKISPNTKNLGLRLEKSKESLKNLLKKFPDLMPFIESCKNTNLLSAHKIFSILLGHDTIPNLEYITNTYKDIFIETHSFFSGNRLIIAPEISKLFSQIVYSNSYSTGFFESSSKSEEKLNQFYYPIKYPNIYSSVNGINEKRIELSSGEIKLGDDQKVTQEEISSIIKYVKHDYNALETNQTILLLKSETKLRHSILIKRLESGFQIIIKPAVKVRTHGDDHDNIKSGSFKIVKTSGVEIILSKTKNPQIRRVVVVSSTPDRSDPNNPRYQKIVDSWYDTNQMEKLDKAMVADGFSPIKYIDKNGLSRISYVQEYKGEELWGIYNQLDESTRFTIIKQLLEKFSWNFWDVKLNNMVWDGTNVSYIDTDTETFTFMTTEKENFENTNWVRQQKIFGLLLALWFLHQGQDDTQTMKGLKFTWRKTGKEKMTALSGLDLQNPFTQLLKDTFHLKINMLNFKSSCKNILNRAKEIANNLKIDVALNEV